MTHPRHTITWQTHGLAFAIALSPALMQGTRPNGCEPTVPLTSLEVLAAQGTSTFEPPFPVDRRSHQAVLDTGSTGVVLRAYTEELTSEIRYELFDLTSDSLVVEGSLPAGGGEVLLLSEISFEDRGTPPPCRAHELRVHVVCPPDHEGLCIVANYQVRVAHEDHCPHPMPCPPDGCLY